MIVDLPCPGSACRLGHWPRPPSPEVFPAPLGDRFFEQDQAVLASGIAITHNLELHLYPTRSEGWCLTHKEALRGSDRKIIGVFESISSFQNFDVIYINQKRRLQWSAHVFDHRDFFVIADNLRGNVQRVDSVIAFTGVRGSLIYPLGVNHRVVAGLGYFNRDINFNVLSIDPEGNPEIGPREDDYPEISADIIGPKPIAMLLVCL